MVGFVPLIVRAIKYNTHLSQFDLHSEAGYAFDVFLYYKQWAVVVLAPDGQ